ncbi:histidine ammonia-lyase [candidate division WOR-3 bacterium]|jgi:histidine ammonia-lyase|nr:histidine ammonia-lyase [candidate division WOR-3 bacterium]
MVILDGYNLTINNLVKIAHNCEQGKIKKSQWSKIRDAERFIKKQVASNKTVYGFNTGFGALAQVHISARDLKKLQHNLLLSHNSGVGQPFAKEMVRAALCLRINTLIRGHSGVSERLIKNLMAILNKNIIPIVPQKGSVGASGDLAPLAAIGLVLIGKGKVIYNGKTMPAKKALCLTGIKILELKPKEGLSLINGTQFSTGIAGLINHRGMGLCDIADIHGAMSLDALKGTDTPFNKNIFELRPHPGAITSAKNIRNLIKGSLIMKSHKDCKNVQDPYSLRCMAQVHGAVRDIFSFTRKTIEIEMNSVTDNPLVFPEKDLIFSNGNFHAEPVAFALDMMAIGLAEIASISERRTFRLLDSKLSGLNAFLTMKPGLNSGFMMAQVTAAALVSQNKILCHPASVDSIPTSANQEDHVSMSMNAGLKALEVLENTKYVLAIEMLCACQALDMLKPLKTSTVLEKIKKKIRKSVPFNKTDQPLTPEIEKIKGIIEKDLIK